MAGVGIALEVGVAAEVAAETMAQVLGGATALGQPVHTAEAMAAAIRAGLPAASLLALAERLGLDREAAAIAFGITPRTLSRRLAAQDRLTPLESDRLARVARLFGMAIITLGDERKAAGWLRAPNRGLGGEVPLALLDTDLGTGEVEAVLGRIALGGYS